MKKSSFELDSGDSFGLIVKPQHVNIHCLMVKSRKFLNMVEGEGYLNFFSKKELQEFIDILNDWNKREW